MAGFCACGRLTNFAVSVGAPVCLSCSMAQGGVIDVWDSDEEIRLSDGVVSNSDGEAMDSGYDADVESVTDYDDSDCETYCPSAAEDGTGQDSSSASWCSSLS